ncbi:GTPase-associated system all-helical protein GASH [Burkholderia semiarida]|uniref:GTPase-associated system all-helical protein GASH n=1 Tax=Burkholderia TaxID=32008 RepID=UPI00265FCADD|nr:GTPase-associated system all-helical protein GASH [Burkholderia sp. AU44665]MDN7702827.1 GTPase-associated system all-helical protein GASH [Burkholderia sp. AU44665]
MANLLSELIAAGWIEKLDGQDERLQKLERAAESLAAEFKKEPQRLIPAILAALASDVTSDDPSIQQAEQALISHWQTVESVHTDKPIGIYRALLLAGCAGAADGSNAAILWLTAVDMLPFSRLGRAEASIRKLLESFAERAESEAISLLPDASRKRKAASVPALDFGEMEPYKIKREWLFTEIGAATGPQNSQNGNQPFKAEFNPHWSNSPAPWTYEFANRMKDVIGALSDAISEQALKQQQVIGGIIAEAFKAQSQILQEAITSAQNLQSRDQVRLDTLWWYESLYSPSMRKSYRDIDPFLAMVMMPLDLLAITPTVTPASVAYVLSEAVGRLPGAGFDNALPLSDLLTSVSRLRGEVPTDTLQNFAAPSGSGRLSLRDLVRLALSQDNPPMAELLKRAYIPAEAAMTAPQMARAILRQEQATRLAGVKK